MKIKCKHKWIPIAQFVSIGYESRIRGDIYIVCEHCGIFKEITNH